MSMEVLNNAEVARRSAGGHGFHMYSGMIGNQHELSPLYTLEGNCFDTQVNSLFWCSKLLVSLLSLWTLSEKESHLIRVSNISKTLKREAFLSKSTKRVSVVPSLSTTYSPTLPASQWKIWDWNSHKERKKVSARNKSGTPTQDSLSLMQLSLTPSSLSTAFILKRASKWSVPNSRQSSLNSASSTVFRRSSKGQAESTKLESWLLMLSNSSTNVEKSCCRNWDQKLWLWLRLLGILTMCWWVR